MASCTFNTLQQQNQLLSFTLCKYPSPLNSVRFRRISHFLFPFSRPKRTLQPKFSRLLVDRAHGSPTHAKLSTADHEISTKNVNLRTEKQTGSGFSSSGSVNKGTQKNSVETLFRIELEEKERTEKRFTKDERARKNSGSVKRRNVAAGSSSLRSKGDKAAVKSSQNADSVVSNLKIEKRSKDGNNNKVGEGSGKKRSKTNKAELPGVKLKMELDMCSKRGDVMGAIQLYDKAQKEGIKIGEYFYTVVLYLCSSAAVGVVQPAKSGKVGRTLNNLGLFNVVPQVNLTKMDELRDRSNGNSRGAELVGGYQGDIDETESCPGVRYKSIDSNCGEKENLIQFSNGSMKPNSQLSDGVNHQENGNEDLLNEKCGSSSNQDNEILVSEDVKKYALHRGFEIYEKMCLDKVPMNEATFTAVARMAMSMGNGDMAFDMVKKMKSLGINPRLRSYGPALFAFCGTGDIDKAFSVEKHMLENGVSPEEPELEALLRLSVGAGKGDKVYYLLHKLRTTVRKVLPSTADIIAKWFESKAASRVGKKKWDQRLINEAIENGGGGWHGKGWLGSGRWFVSHTAVGADALCKCCREKLAMIDLDPTETENFAQSVASIATKREKSSNFQKFQRWLDYYGPFEAVIDAANVGLFSQKRFLPSKVNAVVNGIRQMLPSRRWPLIVLHNRRVTGRKMEEPANKALFEKWRNADALYATPTGSNDDWYWLYAAIKFKCLIVTNDEMRDHTFQLLGNDFFPRWKERHQVHFSFSDAGLQFHMPPPYSVVIQESEKGHWHIPIKAEHECEGERTWLCISRSNSHVAVQSSPAGHEGDLQPIDHHEEHARPPTKTLFEMKSEQPSGSNGEDKRNQTREMFQNLRNILRGSVILNDCSVLSELEAAEKLGDCVINFQI